MKTSLNFFGATIASLFACFNSGAQITINSDQVMQEGTAALFGMVDIASPIAPIFSEEVELAPGATWDFTWVEPVLQQNRKIVSPIASPYADILPGNRVELRNNGGAGAEYFSADEERIVSNGGVSPDFFPVQYDTAEVRIKFPFTVGQTHEGNYFYMLSWYLGEEFEPGVVVDSIRTHTDVTYNYMVISSGTLELPSGEFDVLLQKIIRERHVVIDHFLAGAENWSLNVSEIEDTQVEYVFWAEGQSFPVMNLFDFGSSGIILDYQWLHQQSPLSVEESPELEFTVFPNPASDHVMIDFKTEGEAFYTIFDATGKTVERKRRTGPLQRIDLKGLSAGLYFLQVENSGIRETTKIIIQ